MSAVVTDQGAAVEPKLGTIANPELAKIATLVEDAHRDKWKDVRQLCQDLLVHLGKSGGESRKSRKKNGKVSSQGNQQQQHQPQLAPRQGGGNAKASDILLCRAYQARANRELGKFEDALHECQAIIKSSSHDEIADPRLLEQIRHVFQAYKMEDEILDMYAKAYSHTGGKVEELARQLFFCYGRKCKYDLQQKLAMKMFRSFKMPIYAVWAATVMCLQLQDADLPSSKRDILLMTSERMIERVAASIPKRGQATEFFLSVLEQQGKFSEAISVLTAKDGPFASAADEKLGGTDETLVEEKIDITATEDDEISYVRLADLKSCTMLPAERLKLLARLSISSGDLETAYLSYMTILKTLDADDWEAYIGIIDVAVKQGEGKEEELLSVFRGLESDTSTKDKKRLLRGPFLSQVALMAKVLGTKADPVEIASRMEKLRLLVQRYYDVFGSKPCCFGDLKLFLQSFVYKFNSVQKDSEQRTLLVEYLRSQAEANSPRKHFGIGSSDMDIDRQGRNSSKDMPLKERLKIVRRCTTAHQLLRYLGEHHRPDAMKTSVIVSELVAEYKASQSVHALVLDEEEKKLAEEEAKDGMVSQVQREYNCGDDLLLMAAHAILHGDPHDLKYNPPSDGKNVLPMDCTEDSVLYVKKCLQALACLQVAHHRSPDNFHLRLLIMLICSKISAFDMLLPHYDSIDAKHVQLETLSFLILDAALSNLAIDAATQICERIVHFHKDNAERVPEYMQVAFEHANVSQVQKFRSFRDKLLNSMLLARARAERGVLMFSRQRTPGEDMRVIHDFLKQRILLQGVSTDLVPGDEFFADISLEKLTGMRSNEDRNVILSWNPPVSGMPNEDNDVETEDSRSAEHLRLQTIIDSRIEMIVPKIMVWAFEGKQDTMEEHCQALENVLSFAEGQEVPSLVQSLSSRKCMALMARAVQDGLTYISNQKNEYLQAALSSLELVAQKVSQIVGPTICGEAPLTTKEGNMLLLNPRHMANISRFLRVDAFFLGTMCHACYRRLPADVLKLGGAKKKKKKGKGKKGKKGRSGSSTNSAEGLSANKLRLALTKIAQALVSAFCSLKNQLESSRKSLGSDRDTLRSKLGLDACDLEWNALSDLPDFNKSASRIEDQIIAAHASTLERTITLLQDRIDFVTKVQ